MKGLDLSTFEDQRKLLWIPMFAEAGRVFVGGRQGDHRTYRIRPQNLDCRLGGGKHNGLEYWGRDFANKGLRGIVEVDVYVCVNCGRDRR